MVIRPLATEVEIHSPRDPNTLSNYHNWRTQHVTANLEVDFEKKRLHGSVGLKIRSLVEKGESKEVILDTSFLSISKILVNGKEAKYDLAKRFEPYGSPLTIKVEDDVDKNAEILIDIALNTTDECTALQWMTPEQTPNKRHPYMFSQCQAIHARSIFPCQDTPDVKATVDFNIRSPLPVLASGLPVTEDAIVEKGKGTHLYQFKQQIPIPSYLFAIASGDVASASIGPRSKVWTGPEELRGCQWELEDDMEGFLKAGEKVVYPYAWGTYNVLVLPASFPYGGMENPIVTFATPTIISKDRQNIDVIAHELAHSWSGNLVTNCSWEHFWLNEGWTVYLERRIQAAIHGEPFRGFSSIIGWKALQDSVERFGEDHEFTKLIVDMKGKDPDDAFSSVPYEKGFVFLYYLENLVGKDKWDKFIPHYFTTYRCKSLDSYEFKTTLLDFFSPDADASKALADLDWDKWFYSPGYPPKPDFDDSMVKVCYALADKWRDQPEYKPSTADIDGWLANQSVVFLEAVQNFESPLSAAQVQKMGEAYGYGGSSNVELVSRYFIVGLKAKDEEVYQPTAALLGTVGRMKFVRPLYRELVKCDRKLAEETFQKNKGFYHPICRQLVEKDLYG